MILLHHMAHGAALSFSTDINHSLYFSIIQTTTDVKVELSIVNLKIY